MEKEEIIRLLEVSKNSDFGNECIAVLKSSGFSVKVYKTPTNKKRHLETLSKRKKSSDSRNIQGLENVILELEKSTEDAFMLMKITTDKETYSAYFNLEYKRLLGIMRNENIKQEKYLSLEAEYEKKGLNTSPKWQQY